MCDSATTVRNLLLLYTALLGINIVLSAIIWRHTRGAPERSLFFGWTAGAFSFAIMGLTTHNDIAIAVGFGSVFFSDLALAFLLAGLVDLRIQWLRYVVVWVASLGLATGSSLAGLPFWVTALPVAVAVAAPLLHTTWRAFIHRRAQLTIPGKAFAASCLLFCAHNLDFPFLRDQPQFAALGFTLATIIALLLSFTTYPVVVERITAERTRLEEKKRFAEMLVVTDDVTKAFNARYLDIVIPREIARAKRYQFSLSVVFLDLDGFKGLNDRHGHVMGSTALAEVSALLSVCVRTTDVVARYGGDEFVLVLPQTELSGALELAERVRSTLRNHRFLQKHGLHVRLSASFGVATYPLHADSATGLIQKADQTMYRAKQATKDAIEVAA